MQESALSVAVSSVLSNAFSNALSDALSNALSSRSWSWAGASAIEKVSDLKWQLAWAKMATNDDEDGGDDAD